MATVKVKLRPSKVEGKAGVIFYRITHNRKTQNVATKIRVHPSDWDAGEGRPLPTAQGLTEIQNRLDNDVKALMRVVSDLEKCRRSYTVDEIVSHYKSFDRHILVLDYMNVLIDQLISANRFGTAKNYRKVMCSFSGFLKDVQLSMSELTGQIIAEYNIFLVQRGLTRNSVSFYMRILRAVYNKAVRQKLIEQEYPFADVYTGIDYTRKRAVPEPVIARLNRLELPDGSPIALTRDLFIFSYCTRGMAFVDMAYLRKDNLHDGTISYSRRKTGQQLSVKIEPGIQRIIDRYAGADSPYVFPLLRSLDAAESYEQYQFALNNHNRLLRRLSRMLGSGCRLTSYTSRHSWATAARNHNIPISVISQGMGHTTEQTTRIYLTMLENSVIDDANNEIIKGLGL